MPEGESAGVLAGRPRQVIEPSVRVRDVSKQFVVPHHRAWSLKERLRHPIVSFRHERFEALRDVSFEVEPGEFFAVIGRNGSGKSTLLRCIAGIYELDGGKVEVNGSLAPFIELGVGFQPRLDAFDNVAVSATLMGLRPSEARERFPEVIGFAELEEFAELPIASYSSGMQSRLAFSTSFAINADVLLLDEVLAVGDALFRRKCRQTFERLISKGHTIIYVTHSLDTVSELADRVLLLERGKMVSLGEPEVVLEEYERLNRERELSRRLRLGGSDRYAEIVDSWLESAAGERISTLHQGDEAHFHFTARLRHDTDRPAMGFAVRDTEGRVVLQETDLWRKSRRTPQQAGKRRSFSALFPTSIEPGSYEVSPLLVPLGDEGPVELPGGQIKVEVEPARVSAESQQLQQLVNRAQAGGRWSPRRFFDVCLILARTEFKLRYLDSVVGYLWALGQPLMMFGVLYVIWTEVIQVGADTPHYGLNLLLGIAVFTFFSEATGHALPSLLSKGKTLRNIRFPPVTLPLSSVLTSSFVYGLSLVIVFGFVFASGIAPSLAWLELVPLLALLVVFTAGCCMFLSLVYVPIRDVQQIWLVVNRLLFFMTPVFYPIELAPDGLRQLLMMNPLAVVVVETRHALIDPSAPSAAEAAGGVALLAVPLALAAGLTVATLWLYDTHARRLAERV